MSSRDFPELRRLLIEELGSRPSGLDWCARHASLADELVRSVFAQVVAKGEGFPPFAVVATGGYGRSELSPWSDLDLAIVPHDESSPGLERAIKDLYRELVVATEPFGLRMGYTLVYVADAPSLDPTVRSGLIDARFVVGSREPFEALTHAFWESFPVAEFLIAKIEERQRETAHTNDTPLATQPHLKLGAGGLRSFQAANWIGAATGERMVRPGRAYDEVLKVRNLVHFLAGRAFETFTHEKRGRSAELLGLDPFDLGSLLATSLAELNGAYTGSLERLLDTRFALARHVEAVRGEARPTSEANVGHAAIGIARATRLGLRVSDARVRPSGEVSASQALGAVAAGERTLRNLDRCGVLDALLPELTACRTLMPRDSSHDYTVFEHTIRVVRNLDCASEDAFFGPLLSDLRDAAPLYLAALLHDVGRRQGEEGHEESGAEIALAVCERWGVYESTKDDVCWLVREHLSLNRTLRMRDVSSPETAIEFADLVGTPERLSMLALLTWADVRAVGPNAWTQAQEAFLKELYGRTLAVLDAGVMPSTDAAVYRKRLIGGARDADVDSVQFAAFLDSMPAHYLVGTEPALAQMHFGLVRRAQQGETGVVLHDRPELGATDVTVCCPDSRGLLSRILGVLYALDLGIISIRAATTSDVEAVALDTITVSFGGRPIPAATATRLDRTMKAVIGGSQSIEETMLAAKKDPDRPQNVLTYTFLPGDPAIVEINAPRGRGMAYRLARQLSLQGINILSARVGQWAGSGTAAFYVTGSNGHAVDQALVARALENPKV